jgi:hypothetical protein
MRSLSSWLALFGPIPPEALGRPHWGHAGARSLILLPQSGHWINDIEPSRWPMITQGLGRPHGLRPSAITAALEATNGTIAEVMKFSRHKDPKVLMKVDDTSEDGAGDITGKIDLGRGPAD